MLEKDPKKRISLPEALNHDFFSASKNKLSDLNVDKHKGIVQNLKNYKQANSFNKAVRICMSKIYDGQSIDRLKELFLAADVDHNGKLDREEFQVVMRKLEMADDEIEMVWRSLDSSGNGELE